MKKVININFQGQVIAIEETAYEILKQYIESLKRYFSREEDGNEIVNDIENRIAELFGNRLKLGINCITDEDVESIVASIGRPEDFDADFNETMPPKYEAPTSAQEKKAEENSGQSTADYSKERNLYRNANDKILGGVCSGIAHYLRVDLTFVRIGFILLFSVMFWVYIILWIILRPMPLESNIAKRLYRNMNDKVLGGVCGGIATYFKIESWIPRIIFVLPLLLNILGMVRIPFFPWNHVFEHVNFNFGINFTMVIAYLILWMIIPKASSVKQKLEMMGEEEYIKSIRNTVSDNVASVKSKQENESSVSHIVEQSFESHNANDEQKSYSMSEQMPPQPPKTSTYKTYSAPDAKPERSGCLTVLSVFFKIVFFTFVSIFAIIVSILFCSFLFAGASLMQLQSLFIDNGIETTLLWITIICTLGVPAISMVVWIVRKARRDKSRPVIGYVASAIWIVGIVTGILLAARIADNYKVEGAVVQNITITQPSGNKLLVDLQPYTGDYYTVTTSFGDGGDISGLPYYNQAEDSLLFDNIQLNVIESPDSLYHIRTEAVSSGSTPRAAKANAAQFDYVIQQNDSVLLLPEFFKTPLSQGFRIQGMVVEIAVPVGKRIEMDNRLNDYKSRGNVHFKRNDKKTRRNNHWRKSMKWHSDEEYIMDNGELKEVKLLLNDSIL